MALHTFSIIGSFSVQSHHQSCNIQMKQNPTRYFSFCTSSIQQRHCVIYINMFMNTFLMMEKLCFWSPDLITELHLNIAQAPLRCLPGSWIHLFSTDQCRGRKGDMKKKPHSTKCAPLWGTQPKDDSDCSSVSFMRSSLNVIVHHWDHINSMQNKVNLAINMDRISVMWLIGTELRSGICRLSHLKRFSTFRSATWINTIPLFRENNAKAILMDRHL